VDVYRNGRRAESVSGDILRIATVKAETLLIRPAARR